MTGPSPEGPPGPVEPPRPLSGRNAAIIFGGMVLLFVVALVVVLAGPGETKVPLDTSTTTVGSQPTPPSSSPPNDPGPAGGSLRSRVEQQVGPFQLQVVNDAEPMGANERLQAVYLSTSGVQVTVIVAAWPTAADAERDRQGWAQLLVEDLGYQRVEEKPVLDTGGARLGTVGVYHAADEFVVWTNARMSVLAVGPIDQARAFYDASKY